jgi:uncharacterized protein
LIAGPLVLLLAYFIRGISGFGSGLIAVPLLAHFQPLQFVVPFILMLDFTASAVLGRHVRHQINWSEIKILLPFGFIGVGLGATLLIHLPKEPLLAGLGIFVVIFGVRNFLPQGGDSPVSLWWAIPAGLAGGTVGAMFGTGGPPYIIYLSHRLREKSELRATFSGLFLLDGGFRLVSFLVAGLLLQPSLLLVYFAALPLVALGLHFGHKVHVGISNQQMLKLIGILLLTSGASLLWKAWA